MAHSKKYDVIIIGGGPAGSTAATLLAKNGHSVLVLEKAKFPRDHVGESLLPFCYSLFEQLGILDHMKKTYVRKPGVRFLDSDGNYSTTWCFGHVLHGPDSLSFHVPRGVFDQMLLENSRKHGAMVEEEGDGVAREHEGSRLVDPETVLDAGPPEPERQEGRGEEQEPEDGSAAARRRSHVRRPPSPGLKILTTHVPLRFVIAVSSSSG